MDNPTNTISATLVSEWLKHPVTNVLINKLKEHKEKFAKELMTQSINYETADAHFRVMSANMKTTDSILNLINNIYTNI